MPAPSDSWVDASTDGSSPASLTEHFETGAIGNRTTVLRRGGTDTLRSNSRLTAGISSSRGFLVLTTLGWLAQWYYNWKCIVPHFPCIRRTALTLFVVGSRLWRPLVAFTALIAPSPALAPPHRCEDTRRVAGLNAGTPLDAIAQAHIGAIGVTARGFRLGLFHSDASVVLVGALVPRADNDEDIGGGDAPARDRGALRICIANTMSIFTRQTV
ncbi:hypothetical protein B0H16DRAFT_1750672 [Mycena metata]|uniref:Uncharacterized protein n=1 Tax=Mycena metata TaxID=1033252 RepID=A0AAD7GM47_9AGAR|nr:hypothetical protein B0H16DRAFT_1750672 [Mycena metata]